MSQSSSRFVEQVVRGLVTSPLVQAAFAGGALATGKPEPFGELDLHIVADPAFETALHDWLTGFGELAHVHVQGRIGRAILSEGLTTNWFFYNQVTDIPTGLVQMLNRPGAAPSDPTGGVPDVAQAASRFWDALYRAAASIGRGDPFTTHARLEEAREGIINLYRVALRPANPGAGFTGLEGLGATKTLEPLTDWLVCGLDTQAQWRCATKLAQAYESLMLPLAERLGLAYPWALRKLAFARLDEVRPDRPPAPDEEPKPQQPTAGKLRIKRKG